MQPHFQITMHFIEKLGLDRAKCLLTNHIPPVEMRLNEKTAGKSEAAGKCDCFRLCLSFLPFMVSDVLLCCYLRLLSFQSRVTAECPRYCVRVRVCVFANTSHYISHVGLFYNSGTWGRPLKRRFEKYLEH